MQVKYKTRGENRRYQEKIKKIKETFILVDGVIHPQRTKKWQEQEIKTLKIKRRNGVKKLKQKLWTEKKNRYKKNKVEEKSSYKDYLDSLK